MVAPSLSTAKSERIDIQNLGVKMIEETLQNHQEKLIEAVAVAKKSLSDLEGSKESLTQNLDGAKANLEQKRSAFLAAHAVREDVKTATKSAESALTDAVEL